MRLCQLLYWRLVLEMLCTVVYIWRLVAVQVCMHLDQSTCTMQWKLQLMCVMCLAQIWGKLCSLHCSQFRIKYDQSYFHHNLMQLPTDIFLLFYKEWWSHLLCHQNLQWTCLWYANRIFLLPCTVLNTHSQFCIRNLYWKPLSDRTVIFEAIKSILKRSCCYQLAA